MKMPGPFMDPLKDKQDNVYRKTGKRGSESRIKTIKTIYWKDA